MSFNRLTYDTCTYKKDLAESVGVLDWVLDPIRYENDHKCRHELGLVGGTAVSHISGNLVDLESDLRGQTRIINRCGCHEWQPQAPGVPIKNDKTPPINTSMLHLPSCQMISYRSVPLPAPMGPGACGR